MQVHISNSVTDEIGTLFLAQDLEPGSAQPDETEQLEIMKLPFDECLDWVRTGRITDVVSATTVLRIASERLASPSR